MTKFITRRRFLQSASTAFIGGVALATFPPLRHALAAVDADHPAVLRVVKRTLDIQGKAASVFGIQQPDGTSGLTLASGDRFAVDLTNACGEETVIHWHGQTPPFEQDGVMDHTRAGLKSDETKSYDFAARTGTHWMHSHHGLQEQQLMAAPLIVHAPEDAAQDAQEVVILLHDFSFKNPVEILEGLKKNTGGMHHMDMGDMPDMDMSHIDMTGMDLNDVNYDAYLANDRTFHDPQIVRVDAGGHVRLRIINGATTTGFWIDLGVLHGSMIAVDGTPIHPMPVTRVPLSMGQRVDILVAVPHGASAWPITAQREGAVERTGIILATRHASIRKISSVARRAAPALTLALEHKITAQNPLEKRAVDVTHRLNLTGSMEKYTWSLNNKIYGEHSPVEVRAGQRVALEFINKSMMAHPMHLHGHAFQVTSINGRAVHGAVRDTVLVPMGAKIRVEFDADNSGRWPLHCHNLMHMASGMMTELVYE